MRLEIKNSNLIIDNLEHWESVLASTAQDFEPPVEP